MPNPGGSARMASRFVEAAVELLAEAGYGRATLRT